MSEDISHKLVIAISSRALFDLDASHRVFETQGIEAYANYQIAHEDDMLQRGVAFHLVKKLLSLRSPTTQQALVEVVLISRNSADTGLRIFNSIQHYQLDITRAVFTRGESPYHYLTAFGAQLFLSAHPEDVEKAIAAGCAAATILSQSAVGNEDEQLRIAFDGDAVLFSDEAERVFQTEGIAAFNQQESLSAKQPLSGGPFKGFLAGLHRLQKQFPAHLCPIRTALVTARAAPAHERVIRTLREWNIRIDEAIFLGGLDKANFLEAFAADFFFDDKQNYCQSASHKVPTAHVPFGIINE
jgi:5'-nucleotidase